MKVLFVANREEEWPYQIPGTAVARAREYLTGTAYTNGVCERVVNLCRCDRYQGRGYYVSLLAEARGHKPIPEVGNIEDLVSPMAGRLAEKIEPLLETALQHERSGLFQLECYFGVDPSGRHPALARRLFALVRAPLLRCQFEYAGGRWRMKDLKAIGVSDVASGNRACLPKAAAEYVLAGAGRARSADNARQPAIALLYNEDAPEPPSNPPALEKFLHAARSMGMRAEIIDRNAVGRLKEFDALFIRDTTHIGHYTYEFSRRATDLGLAVIDDPESIVQCNNKVFLNELLGHHHIQTPKTLMVHRDNIDEIVPTLGLPCIIKKPDSAFYLGVRKIQSAAEVASRARKLLENSELIIAQQFVPTDFDWRVTLLDRRPLFVAKYFMAPGHWQVIKRESSSRIEGRTAAVTIGEVPQAVVAAAWKAADLIGDGLYGVDLKQVGDEVYVIEINDNPNVDSGNEDGVLGDALYREVMGVFARRIRERKRPAA